MDKKFAGNIVDIDKNLLSSTVKINQKGLVKYFSNSFLRNCLINGWPMIFEGIIVVMDKKFTGNIENIDKNLLSSTRKIDQKGLVKYFSNSFLSL